MKTHISNRIEHSKIIKLILLIIIIPDLNHQNISEFFQKYFLEESHSITQIFAVSMT